MTPSGGEVRYPGVGIRRQNTEPRGESTGQRAWELLRPLRGRIALAVLAGSGAALSAVGLLTASALLISQAALRPAVVELAVLIGIVRLLALGRGTFRYLERIASHDAALRSLSRMRIWFYERLEPLAPGGLRDDRKGDLLGRFASDVDSLQSLVVRGVVPLAVAAVATAASLALAWVLLPAGSVVLGVLAVLTGVGVPWISRRLESAGEQRAGEARGRLSAETADLLDGAPEILAFGRERDWLDRLENADAALEAVERRVAWRGGLREGLGTLAWCMAPVAMLVTGIPAVRAGRMPGVDLAALALLGMATLDILRTVPAALDALRTDLRTAQRLFGIADRPSPVTDPATPLALLAEAEQAAAGLNVEGLRVRYARGLEPAIDGVDLRVEAGARTAVVGPSGAGKTTLAHTLLRFVDVEAGTARLGAQDIRAYAQADVRRMIGLLAQNTHVFNATIGANVRLARPEATEDELAAACDRAGLAGWLATLPLGLDTPAGEDGALVSGGERQRIALARVLLAGSPVLVLDEPTANLDPPTGRRVIDDLLATTTGRTVVLITHDLGAAARCDEIVVVDGGRTVEHGTHAELIALGGRYARMCEPS